jgi:uncharacterized protein with ParB-like and HNH nuclease domain
MKSETITVQQLFQDRRQYCVPFYQRAYVWTRENQWEQLWDDIREKAESRLAKAKATPHFLGAVVLDPQTKEGLIGVDILHIIDGQQRLTTLQFALTAILLTKEVTNQEQYRRIVDECVHNSNPETMKVPSVEKFKVWPTFRDRKNYTQALTVNALEDLQTRFPAHFTQGGELRRIGSDHPPALAALWFFTRAFERWLAEGPEAAAIRAECLIQALLRDLKLVSIVLEADDDAQVIFETLNGRGAQLHATDLIRNFLFMRADREQADSESLYETLWLPFESDYWSEATRRGRLKKPRLEWLIHTSLQAELREEVDLARLYFEYRRFANRDSTSVSAEKQLLTLTDYSAHYRELLAGTDATPIGIFGRRIAAYDITTLHPLALMISTSTLSEQSKTEMFNDLVSYLVRRFICGLTAKNYNNVFLSVLKQLHAGALVPITLRAVLHELTGEASRWPGDAEFRAACISAPLYFGRLDAPKMRWVLTELEAALRAGVRSEEPLAPDLSNLDIDHILPRSWYAHWGLSDGSFATREEATEVDLMVRIGDELTPRQKEIADRQSHIATLGNLTLLNLSVNREAQNFAFESKKTLLIANTSLRLNIPLISESLWDTSAIGKRGEILANLALKLWPGPDQH